jgi:hypothetical protein
MPNNTQRRRKKDSARLTWSSERRRAPNSKDIDFPTAEIVSTSKSMVKRMRASIYLNPVL